MRRPTSRRLFAALLGAGVLLLVGIAVAWLVTGGRKEAAPTTVTVTTTTTSTTTVTTAPPTTTAPPSTTIPPPPTPLPMSWAGAGAFVADTHAVDPTWLGHQLRDNGFTWLAVKVHDGLTETALEPSWIVRFRRASGLPVGGWGVLRTDPEQEARLAARLGDAHSFDFYIADAEAEYKYTHGDGTSSERLERSKRFVDTFRALRPDLPAGLSSYCRTDSQDLDWQAWSDAGFQFLPQAYVNAQGQASAPAACANAAKRFFPLEAIHPTVGTYVGTAADPSPEDYASMLDAAGTTGFSVYLAETEMPDSAWAAYGRAIESLGIARAPQP